MICYFPIRSSPATYINEALNQQSYIDYVLVISQDVSDFAVLEPDINFSDHLPLFLTIAMSSSGVKSCDHSSPNIDVIYPRSAFFVKEYFPVRIAYFDF